LEHLWRPRQAPEGVTYNVYRSKSRPVPLDRAHRVIDGLRRGSYHEAARRVGDYYVVTAVNGGEESGSSNTVRVSDAWMSGEKLPRGRSSSGGG